MRQRNHGGEKKRVSFPEDTVFHTDKKLHLKKTEKEQKIFDNWLKRKRAKLREKFESYRREASNRCDIWNDPDSSDDEPDPNQKVYCDISEIYEGKRGHDTDLYEQCALISIKIYPSIIDNKKATDDERKHCNKHVSMANKYSLLRNQ